MFQAWKQEKLTAGLVDEAQALSDKLASAKPYVLDSFAATARVWAAKSLAAGQNLYDLHDLTPAAAHRYVTATQTKIAALRKAQDYDMSDGASVWLHTARGVTEPRIAVVVTEIWRQILTAGPNAESMAQDLLDDAGLTVEDGRRAPKGFGIEA
ncbi:MAG: hypothetical protein ACOH2M_16080 [Cypionkella sp.]